MNIQYKQTGEVDFKKSYFMAINKDHSEIHCPGCSRLITDHSVGGYRTYCLYCVRRFPALPDSDNAWMIQGTYPKFKWEPHED